MNSPMKWIQSLSAKVIGRSTNTSDQAHLDRPGSSLSSPHKQLSLKRKAPLSSPLSVRLDSPSASAISPLAQLAHGTGDDPWRAENILVNGPPSEAQWWEEEVDVDVANDHNDCSCNLNCNDCMTEAEEKEQYPLKNITTSCNGVIDGDLSDKSSCHDCCCCTRSQEVSLHEESESQSPFLEIEEKVTPHLPPSPTKGRFNNCGYNTWEQGRAAWRGKPLCSNCNHHGNPPQDPPSSSPPSPSSCTPSSSPMVSLSMARRQNGNNKVIHKQYDKVARSLRDGYRNIELPWPMKLKDVIAIYAEEWGTDSDPW